jgi:hypothetical protein
MEIIIVIFIIALVVFLLGRSCYRSLTGKTGKGGCGGGCQGCSRPDFVEIRKKPDTAP